jgi:hypothetical protein
MPQILVFDWLDIHKQELFKIICMFLEVTNATYLEGYRIEWPNGADYAPEYLYNMEA